MTQKYPLALEICKRSIELNPAYVDAYANEGLCFLHMRIPDSALFYLYKAISVNPKFKTSYTNMAITYKALQSLQRRPWLDTQPYHHGTQPRNTVPYHNSVIARQPAAVAVAILTKSPSAPWRRRRQDLPAFADCRRRTRGSGRTKMYKKARRAPRPRAPRARGHDKAADRFQARCVHLFGGTAAIGSVRAHWRIANSITMPCVLARSE